MSEHRAREWLRNAPDEERGAFVRRPISEVMLAAAQPEPRAFESIAEALQAATEQSLVSAREPRTIEDVIEIGTTFVESPQLRLLVLKMDRGLRDAALQMLAELENHEDNRNLWLMLEEPYTRGDPAWEARAEHVLRHWDEYRTSAGEALPEALMPSASLRSRWWGRLPSAEPFRDACVAVSRALVAPVDGWVMVVAPADVDDNAMLLREIDSFLDDAALRACRWICVIEAL